jgi:hypothetical protein
MHNKHKKNGVEICIIISILFSLLFNCQGAGPDKPDVEITEYRPVDFPKTNNQKIFVHYTPWYETMEISGIWGWHWTMNNKNPDIILHGGRREIASHFYPLIGPYDTSHPDVLEYHVLLMKLSGIDGIMLEWFGTYDIYDSLIINKHAEKLTEYLEKAGLKVIICYEDRFVEEALDMNLASTINEKLLTDFLYLEDNYFNREIYYKHNGNPVFVVFGPMYVYDYSYWTNMFAGLTMDPIYIPLWNFYNTSPDYSSIAGEHAWCVPNKVDGLTNEEVLGNPVYADISLSYLKDFYNRMINDNKEIIVGSAYPGFWDFWEEGGAFPSYGAIPYNSGQTFQDTLEACSTYNPDILQIVTWNDFQEGTQIEPTCEEGYYYLKSLQDFSGIGLTEEDLIMAKSIYDLRKENKGNTNIQNRLTNIFYLIVSNQMAKARIELEGLQ